VVDTTIFGFNIQFNYNLWNARDNTWNGLKFFDSLLLPGSPSPSVTSFIDNTTAAPVWQLGEGMYPLSFGSYRVELTYNLFVEPDFSMTITGQKVSTRGRDITAHDGTVVVPAPSTNNGTARYESQWFGTVASRFGLDIDPPARPCAVQHVERQLDRGHGPRLELPRRCDPALADRHG
jgi:hypothetical protein